MSERIFLNREELEEKLSKVSPGLVLTKGSYEFPPHCSVEDLDWNQMDWAHRPTIHKTYTDSLRIHAEPNFALSLTKLKFAGLNVFVQVSDVKIRPGLFYQCYTVLGLIYIHGVLENEKNNTSFSWYIVSSWWLKPVHRILSKKLYQLNHVQIAEDVALRLRRKELRDKGYSFPPTDRDFVTSNDSRMHTVYPRVTAQLQKDLTALAAGQSVDIALEESLFIIQKIDNTEILLWPKVCPHEGGPLEIANICKEGSIVCPWHNLKFKAVRLSQKEVSCYGASFKFDNGLLVIKPPA